MASIERLENINKANNHYGALGIDATATSAEIRKAYLNLSKEVHPDKNIDHRDLATDVFKKINEAYSVLSDDQARKKYDATLPKEQQAQQKYDETQTEKQQAQQANDETLAEKQQTQQADVEVQAIEPQPEVSLGNESALIAENAPDALKPSPSEQNLLQENQKKQEEAAAREAAAIQQAKDNLAPEPEAKTNEKEEKDEKKDDAAANDKNKNKKENVHYSDNPLVQMLMSMGDDTEYFTKNVILPKLKDMMARREEKASKEIEQKQVQQPSSPGPEARAQAESPEPAFAEDARKSVETVREEVSQPRPDTEDVMDAPAAISLASAQDTPRLGDMSLTIVDSPSTESQLASPKQDSDLDDSLDITGPSNS